MDKIDQILRVLLENWRLHNFELATRRLTLSPCLRWVRHPRSSALSAASSFATSCSWGTGGRSRSGCGQPSYRHGPSSRAFPVAGRRRPGRSVVVREAATATRRRPRVARAGAVPPSVGQVCGPRSAPAADPDEPVVLQGDGRPLERAPIFVAGRMTVGDPAEYLDLPGVEGIGASHGVFVLEPRSATAPGLDGSDTRWMVRHEVACVKWARQRR